MPIIISPSSSSSFCFLAFPLLPYSYSSSSPPFWAADSKGSMSYRTQGRISVCPSEHPNVRTSVRPNVRPSRLPGLQLQLQLQLSLIIISFFQNFISSAFPSFLLYPYTAPVPSLPFPHLSCSRLSYLLLPSSPHPFLFSLTPNLSTLPIFFSLTSSPFPLSLLVLSLPSSISLPNGALRFY